MDDSLAILAARMRVLKRPGPSAPIVMAAPPSPSPQSLKMYLHLRDIAKELGVHPRTVRTWEQQGLRICRINRVVVVRREDLDAFLLKHTGGDGEKTK